MIKRVGAGFETRPYNKILGENTIIPQLHSHPTG